ncbi:hypothetical protein C2S52_008154 [Perilla frutescens var. hirtella]|nr:hypothetical protein C2S52_008154 [Perilla frutescens var. hirtella]
MNRDWMYRRYIDGVSGRDINEEFLRGLNSFIKFACSQPRFMSGDQIRCPCRKLCKNKAFKDVKTVRAHLLRHGFKFNYEVWTCHGERSAFVENDVLDIGGSSVLNQYHNMVMDAAGPSLNINDMDDIEEAPNPEAQRFFDMLQVADNELWPGCRNHSQLSVVARLMNLKSENGISEKCFDQITEFMKEIVPKNNLVPDNFYKTKRLLRGMGLPVEKIDCCMNNCMLYWKGDSALEQCSSCRAPRFQMRNRKKVAIKRMYYFPLTPRLQRLYASNVTANDMSWHASSVDDGIMRRLKKTVGNKARVEGSICNAYLVQEASSFCSFYFEDHVSTRHRSVPRNYDDGFEMPHEDNAEALSIFKQSGRPFGKVSQSVFVDQLREAHPNISIPEIDEKNNSEFANWFTSYARANLSMYRQDFARGPSRRVSIYPAYFVNGYKFHTTTYGAHKATMNSGVCIKGAGYNSGESDYYGRLLEVVEVDYPDLPTKKTVLFKCEWFDTSPAGTQVHPLYKMVSINYKRKYSGDDAFVLASQAIQVFYCSYPSLNRSKIDWLAVCKTQAHAKVHVPSQESSPITSPHFQEDDLLTVTELVIDENDVHALMSSSRGGRGRYVLRRLAHLFQGRDFSAPGSSSVPGSSSTASGSSEPRPSPETSTGSAGMSASVRGLSLGTPDTPRDGSSTLAPSVALEITLAADGSLLPAYKVSNEIGNIFKTYVDGGKKFYWDTAIDSQAKRLTKGRPAEVSEAVWATWCSYWDSPTAQEVSRKAKKNRLADVDGPGSGSSTHKGRSRSVLSYAVALAHERGVPISETLLDTFYKMHRVDDEHYTDPKVARIAEEVDQIVADLSQPLPDGIDPPPVDRNAIYVQRAARSDKGRVFGLGSLYFGTQLPAGTTSHDSSATSPSVVANLPGVRELTSQLQVSRMEQEKLLQKIQDLEARQMESDALQAETARLRAEAEEMKKQLEDTRRTHQQAEEEHRRDKARQELMWQ